MNRYFSIHPRKRTWKRMVIGFLILAVLLMPAGPVLAQAEMNVLWMPQIAADAQGVEPLLKPQVAADVDEEILYHHQDATGNLVAKSDASGQVVWRANSLPFGQGMPTSLEHPLRFADQPQEADSGDLGGLYHLDARYYDPISGRFISADPLSLSKVSIDNPQLFNRYAYGLNNPYRYEDPSGLQPGETVAGPNPRRTQAILQQMANDPHLRPDVREGARTLLRQLERAFHVLRHSPDNLTDAQIRQAWNSINEVRGVVAQRGVSRAALLETLENIGENVRRGGGGGGRGGTVVAIIFFLIAMPSIAEAASEEKYGSMVAQILNLIRPPDFIMPLSPTVDVRYDPATQEVVYTDLFTWWGQMIDSFTADE